MACGLRKDGSPERRRVRGSSSTCGRDGNARRRSRGHDSTPSPTRAAIDVLLVAQRDDMCGCEPSPNSAIRQGVHTDHGGAAEGSSAPSPGNSRRHRPHARGVGGPNVRWPRSAGAGSRFWLRRDASELEADMDVPLARARERRRASRCVSRGGCHAENERRPYQGWTTSRYHCTQPRRLVSGATRRRTDHGRGGMFTTSIGWFRCRTAC